jgi:demethylmenaquinone methyltransferase/2-methoxy-6-polyprenyl-1,4-benzoquinol methylase
MYLWYFNHVLPLIGRLVSGHHAAYAYLPASVSAFSSPDELVKVLRHSGLCDVAARPLSFGIVFLYTGRRG